jgi:xanthine dehydrogenase YagR molybdenum-binding subunit
MDEIAEKLKMDPIDFRKKNFTKINQMQKMPYSSKGLDQCYQLGAETFGWIAKRAASAKGNRAKKRGVGMSSVYWTGGGRVPSQAIVILQPDGAAELVAGIAAIGTGSETVLVQIAAEELGIAPEKIRIKYGDSEGTPYFDTSSGSRTVPQVGPAVRAAAADAKRQLLDRVASWLKVQPEDLEMKGDDISIKKDSGKNISYNEAVKKIGNDFIIGTGRRNSNLEGYALNTFGAHFAEVEVDTETGEVRLIQAVCAHDSGRWINPLTSESQIQGGFLQGAGMALTEERILDSGTGIQLNADFHQYRTPTSFDLPETITPVLVEVLDPNTNIDAKGLGEPPNVGPGGAIANAIYHATGVRIREYPITPNRILAALKERKI